MGRGRTTFEESYQGVVENDLSASDEKIKFWFVFVLVLSGG